MSVRAGEGRGEDDRLPWLETVDEEYREGGSRGTMLLIVGLAAAALLAVAIALWWLQQPGAASGNGALIEAAEGDYKVKPDEPGGMKVEGEGDAVFSTSQGSASNASINVGALPEAPVEGTVAPRAQTPATGTRTAKVEVPAARAAPRPAAPAPAPARPAPAREASSGAGAIVQLGAFPSEGAANMAWSRLSKRFSYVASLGKSVERAQVNDKAVWRLRVNAGSNTQAKELCGRLKVAGESCFVTN